MDEVLFLPAICRLFVLLKADFVTHPFWSKYGVASKRRGKAVVSLQKRPLLCGKTTVWRLETLPLGIVN